MVSPWDSEGRRPASWNPEDPPAEEGWGSSIPPNLDNEGDFPDVPTGGGVSDVGVLDSQPDLPPTENSVRILDRSPRGKKSNRALRKPAVLMVVTLSVAVVVFLGLRIVRVSVSGTSVTAGSIEELVPAPAQTTVTSANVTPPSTSDKVDWDGIARSVVFFEVAGDCDWVGSGTLILDGSYVLTNWHVSGAGECPMRVGLTEKASAAPSEFYPATVVAWDAQIDLAIVRLQDVSGAPLVPANRRPVTFAAAEVRLGDSVRLLGYPVVREDQFEVGQRYTLTLTDGAVSGTENFGERASYSPTDSRYNDYEVWGEYIKHTASQNGGVSGGGAFNLAGELIGIPTAGDEKLELMRSIRFAKALVEKINR